MVALLSALSVFGGMTVLGKYLGKADRAAKAIAFFLEQERARGIERERALNLSKYRTFNEASDPFVLVRIGPEDIFHQGQAWLCEKPFYILLRSECFELKTYLEREAANQEARAAGEAPPFDIGFDVVATTNAGLARSLDEKIRLSFLGVVPTPLSKVKKPEQEA